MLSPAKSPLGSLLIGAAILSIAIAQQTGVRHHWGWAGLALAAALVFSYTGSLLHLRARQSHAATRPPANVEDVRPAVLYLRPFKADQSLARAAFSGSPYHEAMTEEEYVVRALEVLGPVVAAGRPGEPLPALGASRVYFEPDAWRDEIERLMRDSVLTVLRAGDTHSWHWEVSRALDVVPPGGLLFLFPFSMRRAEKQAAYERIRGQIAAAGYRAPDLVGRATLFLWLRPDRNVDRLDGAEVGITAVYGQFGFQATRYLAALRPVFTAHGVTLPARLSPRPRDLFRAGCRDMAVIAAVIVGLLVVLFVVVSMYRRDHPDPVFMYP